MTNLKRRKINKLYDLSIDEISAVDLGANNQKYFLFKRMTDKSLPPTMSELTEEQAENLNKEFNLLSEEEKAEIMKELESISASLDEDPDTEWEQMRKAVGVISETLESLKKDDPLTWAEVTTRPENYTISDDFRKFSRKPDAPPPKPTKYWSEELGRWITKSR